MIAPGIRKWFGCLITAGLSAACDSQWGDQVQHSQYSNYAHAVRADGVGKGWIPEFLPKSATNISEWHNVEIDVCRVEFSFDLKREHQWLTQLFKPVHGIEAKRLRNELLVSRGATLDSRGAISFYELSSNENERGFLAVNPSQGRAQYWTRSQ